MLKFGVLTGKNIMSYGSGGFELDLADSTLTLIQGKNGASKSSIIEALTYCLFGKPYRNIKLAQLINSINNKGLLTTLNFTSGVNSYRIVRGMKPSIFEIYKNGVLIEEDSAATGYQKMLESEIIGFGYKTFKQVCVIGSASYTQFMSLEAKDRRVMIEELLDISVFSKMGIVVKDEVASLKKSIDSVENFISSKNRELERLNTILSEMKESEEKKKTEFKDKITSLENEKIDLNNKIDQYNSIIEELTEKLADDKSVRYDFSDMQVSLRGYMEKIKDSKQTIGFFKTNDHCSVCLQDITEDHKTVIISGEERKNSETMEKSKELYTSMEILKEKISKFDEFLEGLEKARTKLRELQSGIRERDSLLSSLNRELSRENDSEKVIAQSTIVADELREKMVEKISSLEAMDYLSCCVGMLKDTGIKAKIISTYVPLINESINRYLELFDLFVNFELDENFNETIKSRHRDSFTYDSFSEGEKTKIDTAILLTWREIAQSKNSAACSLLFFDETLDSLDLDATYTFLDAMRDQEEVNSFIISHKGLDPVLFDRSLMVEKKIDGFAVIEETS